MYRPLTAVCIVWCFCSLASIVMSVAWFVLVWHVVFTLLEHFGVL